MKFNIKTRDKINMKVPFDGRAWQARHLADRITDFVVAGNDDEERRMKLYWEMCTLRKMKIISKDMDEDLFNMLIPDGKVYLPRTR